MLVLEVAAAFALLLALLWLHFYLTAPPHITGRDHRRPGYIRPSLSASGSANHTTAPTPTREGTSTGCRTGGPLPAGAVELGTLHALSRITAPTVSGGGTASHLGAPTIAVSPVGELAVTGSALSGVSDGRGDDRQHRCVPVPGDLVSLVWPDGITRWYQDGAA